MAQNPARAGSVGRRVAGVAVVLALLATVAPAVGASVSQQQVDRARAKVARLRVDIERARAQYNRIQANANDAATAFIAAQYELELTLQALQETRLKLEEATNRYEDLRALLDARAAEAFMAGPGSGIEFILGASSLTDLSDRLEFMDAAAQTDIDLATEVQNLRNQLEADKTEFERLRAKQVKIVDEKREKRQELTDLMTQQQALLGEIERKERLATEEARKLSKQYQRQLAQQFSGKIGKGVFKVCPVDPVAAVSNSFGAPRVGHLHAGVDIFADMGTPIRAPFDGIAEPTSGGLGGYSVYVYGAEGYVYNAHLSQPSTVSGHVEAGAVIGYVGTSGNAAGTSPHNHFEWHPDVIPTDWPVSPYGYSVLGDAVNPYPLLVGVC